MKSCDPYLDEIKRIPMTQDEEHLRLLSIFHYVVAGLTGLFSLFPIFHLVIGLLLVFAPEKMNGKGEMPPVFLGWLFVIFAATIMIIGFVLAIMILTTGRFLAKRKHHLFCFIMACIECLFMPFGTVLGVFTIIVLSRESVKQLFEANHSVHPNTNLNQHC